MQHSETDRQLPAPPPSHQFAPFSWVFQVSLWDSTLVRSSWSLFRFWESSESERCVAGLRDGACGPSLPLPLLSLPFVPTPHPEPGLQPPVPLWFSGWGGAGGGSLILSYPELSSASVQLGALARFVTSEQLPTEQKNPVRRRCLETPHPSPTRLLLHRP